jgi:hypothetical protein
MKSKRRKSIKKRRSPTKRRKSIKKRRKSNKRKDNVSFLEQLSKTASSYLNVMKSDVKDFTDKINVRVVEAPKQKLNKYIQEKTPVKFIEPVKQNFYKYIQETKDKFIKKPVKESITSIGEEGETTPAEETAPAGGTKNSVILKTTLDPIALKEKKENMIKDLYNQYEFMKNMDVNSETDRQKIRTFNEHQKIFIENLYKLDNNVADELIKKYEYTNRRNKLGLCQDRDCKISEEEKKLIYLELLALINKPTSNTIINNLKTMSKTLPYEIAKEVSSIIEKLATTTEINREKDLDKLLKITGDTIEYLKKLDENLPKLQTEEEYNKLDKLYIRKGRRGQIGTKILERGINKISMSGKQIVDIFTDIPFVGSKLSKLSPLEKDEKDEKELQILEILETLERDNRTSNKKEEDDIYKDIYKLWNYKDLENKLKFLNRRIKLNKCHKKHKYSELKETSKGVSSYFSGSSVPKVTELKDCSLTYDERLILAKYLNQYYKSGRNNKTVKKYIEQLANTFKYEDYLDIKKCLGVESTYCKDNFIDNIDTTANESLINNIKKRTEMEDKKQKKIEEIDKKKKANEVLKAEKDSDKVTEKVAEKVAENNKTVDKTVDTADRVERVDDNFTKTAPDATSNTSWLSSLSSLWG